MSFPEGGSIYWDLHGVENGKISLIQGKAQLSGTGVNESTGEVFTIVNDRSKEVEIDIAVNGVSVFTGHGEVTLVGSNGTVYQATSFIHYTINPKGETTVKKWRSPKIASRFSKREAALHRAASLLPDCSRLCNQ